MSARDPQAIRQLFDAVSPTYDLLNRIMTVGSDQRWRHDAAREVRPKPGEVLADLCGGTGKLAAELGRRYPKCPVLLLDFAAEMLRLAGQGRGPEALPDGVFPVVGDALATPLADGACAGVTMGFGLRNLRAVRPGLVEARRILRPGGRLVILEFVRPTGWLAPVKKLVLRTFIRFVVGLVAPRHVAAYVYLSRSITEFLSAEELAGALGEAGFGEVTVQHRLLGIVAIVGGTRR